MAPVRCVSIWMEVEDIAAHLAEPEHGVAELLRRRTTDLEVPDRVVAA